MGTLTSGVARMMAAGLFAGIAAALCGAAALVILGTAHVYLSGPDAIRRDGLRRGQPAPRWSLPDSAGTLRHSPPARPLQLIVFADHSLKSFPSVLDGLRDLVARDCELETVVMLRRRSDLAAPLLQLLGLQGVPVVTGSPALYADYHVRVGPFAIFVDSAGVVRSSSLVNHDWQVAKLRQLAALPIDAPRPAPSRRSVWPRESRGARRPSRAGVAG